MAGKAVRLVNTTPPPKIKTEIISDDDDEEKVACKICNKAFVSETALNNHVRMEHIDVYLTGDKELWTQKIEPQIEDLERKLLKIKSEKVLSKMAPTELMQLASEDVSYIIYKTSDKELKRKGNTKSCGEGSTRGTKVRAREPKPIAGPFECVQPSSLVADGICHQIFFSCCEYSLHYRDEHTRRRKGIRCQVCEKPLHGGDSLMPFPCEVCGAGFSSNKDLNDHVSTEHVKLKPFQCEVCHKRFTQQGGVMQHMRMHTGVRPFSCTYCPKAFTQKSGLDQHLRIHTKVKPYKCIICSKAFCQSVHLKQHMRTHTNVSPFQCGICLKRFKQSSHLNYHLKNHNQSNMTEEQKTEYKKLLTMINESNQGTSHDDADVDKQTDRDNESSEEQLVQTEEVTDDMNMGSVEVLIDVHEQMLAEQSIHIVDGDGEEEEYILEDVVDTM